MIVKTCNQFIDTYDTSQDLRQKALMRNGFCRRTVVEFRIISALLVMTGRITMRGLSRWTGPGGSYRTVQRFCSTVIPWAMLFGVFFRQHVSCPQDVSHASPSCGGMCHGQQSVTSTMSPPPLSLLPQRRSVRLRLA
jgi:hypothetical protein